MRLIRWEAFKSDCSVTCGEGNRTIKYECVQRNMRNNEHSKVVDQSNCPQRYETTTFEVCMQPCNEVLWVYSDWGTVRSIYYYYECNCIFNSTNLSQ